MPFLTDSDYLPQIKAAQLATLIDGEPTNRTTAETMAEAQIRSMIGVRYNAASAFAKAGTERNPEIIMYMIDMVLFHLHSRINPGQVPELRKDRYADALTWLNKVAVGTYGPDLPAAGDGDDNTVDDKNEVQWGGMAPRKPYY